MKTKIVTILTVCALFVMAAPNLLAQTARLQVIHNAADPAAGSVDIYVDDVLLLDDFGFRQASPYVDAPADAPIKIDIAPPNSTSSADAIATFTPTLASGGTYVVIANGLLTPGTFAPNPDGESTAFTLLSTDGARESANDAGKVEFFAVHGATDAPTVDVQVRNGPVLVDNAKYGAITDYIAVDPAEYILEVTLADDNSIVAASFEADLSGLAGGTAVVFASGFLAPPLNQNGPAFGLFAALPNGNVVEFPLVPSLAYLQVIHNAADPAAEMVDIYAADQLLLDDFSFRSATPFVPVPGGVPVKIDVAPSNSTSSADAIATFTPTFDQNVRYVAVASGVLDDTQFEANSDGQAIEFTLITKDGIRTSATDPANVDFVAVHGSTDAPTVDVVARGVATIVDDATYGDVTDYVSVPADTYTLDITPGNDNSTVVATFEADLSGLGGGTAVVFASGFLTPDNDQNGPDFGLFAALADGSVVPFPQVLPQEEARLQIIHNAADPAAAAVDIWLGDDLILDDFAFRTATPFIDVPANVELNIGVAPATSTSSADAIANFTPTLMPGGTYVAVANGVLDPMMFADNPDTRPIGFTLLTKDDIRESANDANNVEFLVLHGATDAPTVDVIARNVAPLVDNAAYGDYSDYISVAPSGYTLDVTPGDDNTAIVASFAADLSGLAGGTAIVFASGFLTPANNQGGPAFGIFAALSNGTVVEFPAVMPDPEARLQIIHNAADPGAASVDIYVDGDLLLDDFAFRTATPFVDVPAEVELNIGVAPPNSTSAADAIATFTATLTEGGTYVAVANGVLDPAQFEANPDGQTIAFTLITRDGIREAAADQGNVEFVVVHGATDAPTVDVIARNVTTLVDDAAYGDVTDYITVPAGAYTLDITPGNDNATVVASYEADLSGLGGGSAVVFASGFLTPDNDQNGAAFGLYAALADGQVVAFMPVEDDPMARLQIIHNAADPGAASVDIYVNDDLLLDDFAFRTATPFVDVPAEVALNIGVAPPNSTSSSDALATIPVTLEEGNTYIAVANGVLDPMMFANNPDGRSIGFTLFTKDEIRESANDANNAEFLVLHGSTDAPTVDVIARGVATLVDDAAYGDITDYLSVTPDTYTLDITPGGDNSTVVASFTAPLSGLAGQTAVVLASGFLNPQANQDGEAFGLIAVLADGTVLTLPTATTSTQPIPQAIEADFSMYPSPTAGNATVSFTMERPGEVEFSVYDMNGKLLRTIQQGYYGQGEHQIQITNAGLAPGAYTILMATNRNVIAKQLHVVK